MKNWIPITTNNEVRSILSKYKAKPQIIFKDSQTCGISAFAKERLLAATQAIEAKADFNYLDLLTYRLVSNFIADELNVRHQSPQVIVIKNEKVVYSVTHHSIDAQAILQHLA